MQTKTYIKKFKGCDVPKGATHYNKSCKTEVEFYRKGFYGNLEVFSAAAPRWVEQDVKFDLEGKEELPIIPEIDWSQQPSSASVWIVDNKGWEKAAWHTLSACGQRYVDEEGRRFSVASIKNGRISVYRREDCVEAPKRHVHADLMIERANDPSITIEVETSPGGDWLVIANPRWAPDRKYRKKSVKTRIEQDREVFVEAAYKVIESNPTAMPKELLGLLFDADFKAPEADKSY